MRKYAKTYFHEIFTYEFYESNVYINVLLKYTFYKFM